MNLRLITPPAVLPVPLQMAKDHARVAHLEEDHMIEGYIAAATERLDGAEGYLGRALITQVWELTLDHFPLRLRLPLPPCQSIDAISYITPDGATEDLDPASYTATGLGGVSGATILFATGKPATASRPDAVAIRFTAGFGSTPAAVPAPIRTAILNRVVTMYDNRESVVIGESARVMPLGEDDLITPYRVWAF
jgi:uncharacterized phiE125 gp8 family phage protein